MFSLPNVCHDLAVIGGREAAGNHRSWSMSWLASHETPSYCLERYAHQRLSVRCMRWFRPTHIAHAPRRAERASKPRGRFQQQTRTPGGVESAG